MINKIALTGITLSALLLSACGGGGGGTTDPMNDKNYIGIFTHVPAGICESNEFSTALSDIGLRNFLTRETDNTTTCATYGKANDDVECAIEYIGGGNLNCVVGFNEIPPGYRGLTRQTSPEKLDNTMELISVNFK